MSATLSGNNCAAKFCRRMDSVSTTKGGNRGKMEERVASVLYCGKDGEEGRKGNEPNNNIIGENCR